MRVQEGGAAGGHIAWLVKLADRNAVLPSWAGSTLKRTKFDRDAVELPRYARVETRFGNQAKALVRSFTGGQIDKKTLIDGFRGALYEAETKVFVAGKRSAGKPVWFVTPGERKMLAGRHSRNMRYFNNFVRDMESGRGRMNYERRAVLYAKSLWSLYNRGQADVDWDERLAPNMRFEWVMDPDAEHCVDCVRRWRESRDKGGFTWDELVAIGFPGENTRCQVNCRCHIQPMRKRVLQGDRIRDAIEQLPGEVPEPVPVDRIRKIVSEAPAEVGEVVKARARAQAQTPSAIAGRELLERVLGGKNLPLRVPAAGLPPVKVEPAVVARAINKAGEAGGELARKISGVVEALVKPLSVYPSRDAQGRDRRVFAGPAVVVDVVRSVEQGEWAVVDIYLVGAGGLVEGGAYNVPTK